MGRPTLHERRKFQTRREIAEAALTLFARDGYDQVGVDAIAEEAGVALRTFYRYFSAKDEVLSPIITAGTTELLAAIVARPAAEPLAEALEHAYAQLSPPIHPDGARALMKLLTDVPALRARWLNDLRTIEERLAPLLLQRAPLLNEDEIRLTAAAIVTALRVAHEHSTDIKSTISLGSALQYLKRGANL